VDDGILSLGIAERNQLAEDVVRRDRETEIAPDPVDMANAFAFMEWLEGYKITAEEAEATQDAWTEAGLVYLMELDHYGTAYVYRQAEPGAVLISDAGPTHYLVPAGEMDSSPPLTGWPPDEDENEIDEEEEEEGSYPYLIRSLRDAYPEFIVRADSPREAADTAARRLYGRRSVARGDPSDGAECGPYRAWEPAVGNPGALSSIGGLFQVWDCDEAGRIIIRSARSGGV